MKYAVITRSILTFDVTSTAAFASCCHWQSQSLGQLQGRSPTSNKQIRNRIVPRRRYSLDFRTIVGMVVLMTVV